MNPMPLEKMTREFINKPLLVVVYPYKFTDFIYDHLELADFKPYCDVLIWDISNILWPNFANAVIVERSTKTDVIVLSSFLDFVRRVYELRKRTVKAKVCIVNEMWSMSLLETICNLIITAFLRTRNVAILDYCNGGVPVSYPDSPEIPNKLKQPGFFVKALRFIKDATHSEAKKTILSVLFQRMGRLLPSATTHRLVAGEDYLAIAQMKGRARKQIKLIFGHSQDYSYNLRHMVKSSVSALPRNKIAVYIDGPGPMFAGDAVYLGRKICFTTDVWYPALCKFFDRIEAEADVRIVIAGHTKSAHPAIAPVFGNRPVHYLKTRELVLNCEFVITRMSTAISYAVMFRKPIIFIYSNQLNEDRMTMHDIRGMAAVLGNVPVNIDGPNININSLLRVNEERYRYYEKACLTSTKSQRPNSQIILEDIMDIATGPEMFSENRKSEGTHTSYETAQTTK